MTFFVLILALLTAAPPQEPSGRGRGRVTPPQPQQKQGVEYFEGKWTFTWTGRESALTSGPRSGVVTFTRQGSDRLAIAAEGAVDDTNQAFKESGSAEWNAAAKTLTITETLANGTTLAGVGNWSSPLSIRYESEPVRVGPDTIRVRRTYSILSAQSFSVAEEMAVNDGAFQRLGNGLFTKQ
jgi:hypothetical protein